MAISENYETHYLLNAWQRLNQENIWHFNQCAGNGAPLSECGVYLQSDREQITESLLDAWDKVTTYLGYFPQPTWTVEDIPFGGGSPWQLQTLRLKYGHFIEWGQRAATLIQAGAAITYSDADGDGVDDTATMTVNGVTATAEEIQIFFRTADGAPGAGDARYQIEPVKVSVAGGVATITGHRALFVKPDTIWDVPYNPSDPNYRTRNYADTALATGFVTAVDVYRVYNDSTVQAQILSDPLLGWDMSSPGTTVVDAALARIVNAKAGIFQARFDCGQCGPPYPQYARVYYRSGLPLANGQPDIGILRAIIRLANANMYRKLCTFCPETAEIWNQDREQETIAQRHVGNPFGTLRGQVAAWITVLSRAQVKGGVLR